MANYLKHLTMRWYDPEIFPTKDLMSETGDAPGFNFVQNANDQQFIFPCDYPGNWQNSYTVFGGGNTDINANPKFPKVVRFTVAVAKDEQDNSVYDVAASLGESSFSVTVPDDDAWSEYTNCIENLYDGDDDCGQYLLFYSGQGEGNPWNGSITNQTVEGFLSVAHTDLFISGWNGAYGANSNTNTYSYQGNNEDWDADYTLTDDDVTNNTLDILAGTDFGEGGVYEAEFNVGERVRIFGSRWYGGPGNDSGGSCGEEADWDYQCQQGFYTGSSSLNPGGTQDINKLFRGEFPWATWDYNDDWYLGEYGVTPEGGAGEFSWNYYGKPVDIDGQGFHSPFFYTLWRATENPEHEWILRFRPGAQDDDESISPDNDPLNPNVQNIRTSDLYANIDSRIKYVIFQNTIGMMNEDISGYGEYNTFATDYESLYENLGGPAQYDYGFVPIAGNGPNYNEGYVHNKVNIYIVFRDEWADEPIFYGQDDPRSRVWLDVDGQARLIDDENTMFINSF